MPISCKNEEYKPFYAAIPNIINDTLAPFLFVIVVDWVMRNSRDGSPAELTDLDFADDIALCRTTWLMRNDYFWR
jgi:hypothetical protein